MLLALAFILAVMIFAGCGSSETGSDQTYEQNLVQLNEYTGQQLENWDLKSKKRFEEVLTGEPAAFTGAKIWTGTGDIISNAALIVQDGRILDLFSLDIRSLPDGIQTYDLSGMYMIPGLINAHGHVGMADGLQTGSQIHSEDNVRKQLALYARYGITTVVSLGDEPPHAFQVREQHDPRQPGMARLYMSGPVLSPDSPEQAYRDVETLKEKRPDWVKIRVDDQLGRRTAMPPDIFGAVIDASHQHDLPVASHMVALDISKELLRKGTNLLAHSIRDEPVDDELVALMMDRDICITPTLTREVSVYIYAERPDFFDDPFFLEYADHAVLEMLQQPDIQKRYTGEAADFYRKALPLAMENMLKLHNSGIRVAMGTDSGPPARFQGYFEHMEMEMMHDAGMSPADVLTSATRNAAECMDIGDNLGTLEPGKWADFILLEDDPLQDIRNLRSLQKIYIAGAKMDR